MIAPFCRWHPPVRGRWNSGARCWECPSCLVEKARISAGLCADCSRPPEKARAKRCDACKAVRDRRVWLESYHRRMKNPAKRKAYNARHRKYVRRPDQYVKTLARNRAWNAAHPAPRDDLQRLYDREKARRNKQRRKEGWRFWRGKWYPPKQPPAVERAA